MEAAPNLEDQRIYISLVTSWCLDTAAVHLKDDGVQKASNFAKHVLQDPKLKVVFADEKCAIEVLEAIISTSCPSQAEAGDVQRTETQKKKKGVQMSPGEALQYNIMVNESVLQNRLLVAHLQNLGVFLPGIHTP